RGLASPERLLEVDDVNAGAFGEDEPAHLRIPPPSLVAEVNARFQQVLQLRLRHALPLVGFDPPPLSSRATPPQGTRSRDQAACVMDCESCLYLFENWNRFRAPARPGFLRSTTRGSRVNKPCSRSLRRWRSSARTSARPIAIRSAPACPVRPPPATMARTSNAPRVSVAVNGCWMCETSDGRGK